MVPTAHCRPMVLRNPMPRPRLISTVTEAPRPLRASSRDVGRVTVTVRSSAVGHVMDAVPISTVGRKAVDRNTAAARSKVVGRVTVTVRSSAEGHATDAVPISTVVLVMAMARNSVVAHSVDVVLTLIVVPGMDAVLTLIVGRKAVDLNTAAARSKVVAHATATVRSSADGHATDAVPTLIVVHVTHRNVVQSPTLLTMRVRTVVLKLVLTRRVTEIGTNISDKQSEI